jgi:hypothetical protein
MHARCMGDPPAACPGVAHPRGFPFRFGSCAPAQEPGTSIALCARRAGGWQRRAPDLPQHPFACLPTYVYIVWGLL